MSLPFSSTHLSPQSIILQLCQCINSNQSSLFNSLLFQYSHTININTHVPSEIYPNLSNGNTLLHVACQQGRLEIVQKLLQYDIDYLAYNGAGLNALHKAALEGHSKVIALLLEHDRERVHERQREYDQRMERRSESSAAYDEALDNEDDEFSPQNLDPYTFVNSRTQSKHGTTALMQATGYGFVKVVHILLKYGADPLLRDNDGLSTVERIRDDSIRVLFDRHWSVLEYSARRLADTGHINTSKQSALLNLSDMSRNDDIQANEHQRSPLRQFAPHGRDSQLNHRIVHLGSKIELRNQQIIDFWNQEKHHYADWFHSHNPTIVQRIFLECRKAQLQYDLSRQHWKTEDYFAAFVPEIQHPQNLASDAEALPYLIHTYLSLTDIRHAEFIHNDPNLLFDDKLLSQDSIAMDILYRKNSLAMFLCRFIAVYTAQGAQQRVSDHESDAWTERTEELQDVDPDSPEAESDAVHEEAKSNSSGWQSNTPLQLDTAETPRIAQDAPQPESPPEYHHSHETEPESAPDEPLDTTPESSLPVDNDQSVESPSPELNQTPPTNTTFRIQNTIWASQKSSTPPPVVFDFSIKVAEMKRDTAHFNDEGKEDEIHDNQELSYTAPTDSNNPPPPEMNPAQQELPIEDQTNEDEEVLNESQVETEQLSEVDSYVESQIVIGREEAQNEVHYIDDTQDDDNDSDSFVGEDTPTHEEELENMEMHSAPSDVQGATFDNEIEVDGETLTNDFNQSISPIRRDMDQSLEDSVPLDTSESVLPEQDSTPRDIVTSQQPVRISNTLHRFSQEFHRDSAEGTAVELVDDVTEEDERTIRQEPLLIQLSQQKPDSTALDQETESQNIAPEEEEITVEHPREVTEVSHDSSQDQEQPAHSMAVNKEEHDSAVVDQQSDLHLQNVEKEQRDAHTHITVDTHEEPESQSISPEEEKITDEIPPKVTEESHDGSQDQEQPAHKADTKEEQIDVHTHITVDSQEDLIRPANTDAEEVLTPESNGSSDLLHDLINEDARNDEAQSFEMTLDVQQLDQTPLHDSSAYADELPQLPPVQTPLIVEFRHEIPESVVEASSEIVEENPFITTEPKESSEDVTESAEPYPEPLLTQPFIDEQSETLVSILHEMELSNAVSPSAEEPVHNVSDLHREEEDNLSHIDDPNITEDGDLLDVQPDQESVESPRRDDSMIEDNETHEEEPPKSTVEDQPSLDDMQHLVLTTPLQEDNALNENNSELSHSSSQEKEDSIEPSVDASETIPTALSTDNQRQAREQNPESDTTSMDTLEGIPPQHSSSFSDVNIPAHTPLKRRTSMPLEQYTSADHEEDLSLDKVAIARAISPILKTGDEYEDPNLDDTTDRKVHFSSQLQTVRVYVPMAEDDDEFDTDDSSEDIEPSPILSTLSDEDEINDSEDLSSESSCSEVEDSKMVDFAQHNAQQTRAVRVDNTISAQRDRQSLPLIMTFDTLASQTPAKKLAQTHEKRASDWENDDSAKTQHHAQLFSSQDASPSSDDEDDKSLSFYIQEFRQYVADNDANVLNLSMSTSHVQEEHDSPTTDIPASTQHSTNGILQPTLTSIAVTRSDQPLPSPSSHMSNVLSPSQSKRKPLISEFALSYHEKKILAKRLKQRGAEALHILQPQYPHSATTTPSSHFSDNGSFHWRTPSTPFSSGTNVPQTPDSTFDQQFDEQYVSLSYRNSATTPKTPGSIAQDLNAMASAKDEDSMSESIVPNGNSVRSKLRKRREMRRMGAQG